MIRIFNTIIYWSVLSGIILGQKSELKTRFEISGGTETATYEEGIAFYQKLADRHPEVAIFEMGPTDSGKPLHLVMYSKNRDFDVQSIKNDGNLILMVNNAIHPGEPDGVEASMMLLRNLAENQLLQSAMDHTVVTIIPFYNIGGVLNRNSHSRANQNGPKAYGFRGNSRNYDLNRDFIKSDTKNAASFAQIYHSLDPDVFIDTHVSNGADYQYVMTLVSSQKDKLTKPIADFQEEKFLPFLYHQMERFKGYEMTPYVNVWGRTPEHGWNQFADWPRYSSGYTALFNTIGMMSETHMLKPFDQRTWATYYLLETLIEGMYQMKEEIKEARRLAKAEVKSQDEFPLTWKLDTSKHKKITFKGYAGKMIESNITEQPRLYYDRNDPYTTEVKYYNYYPPKDVVKKPEYYVIPQGWHNVLERLRDNSVQYFALNRDTSISVSAYQIDKYETSRRPYEGHYYHHSVEVKKETESIQFRKGDILVPVNQARNRYIIETLEPLGEDSFFKWNYFDPILQRKEGYSSYVFEEIAEQYLHDHPDLKQKFEEKKANDESFRNNRNAQLFYIYQQTPHAEPTYLRYPIFRIELQE